MDRKQDEKGPRIPENDPSKAMDSKREVEESNDEKTDQDFPGYPHYPAKEDIMDQRTDVQRVDLDVENLPSGSNATGVSQRFASGTGRKRAENPADADMNDSGDDDLESLDSTNAEIGIPHNVSNDQLDTDFDVPGTDLDEETADRRSGTDRAQS
ncbi:MAG TPA: hypothetical protein VFR58_05625 [Flavisolibacter sp.]|nr:hypothetical protein [Flavisolibacter sp.]